MRIDRRIFGPNEVYEGQGKRKLDDRHHRTESELGDRAASEVTVIARWRDADSYETLRNSPQFAGAMAQFAKEFTGPPRVSVNEILVEM